MWSWLARMIGNRDKAEVCMMFAWHDKQFIDLHYFTAADATPQKYKDPTQYMADPSKCGRHMAGVVTKDAISTEDIASLVWFYLERMPVLRAMWVEVVSKFVMRCTAREVQALHINLPTSGGFEFESPLWMGNFFGEHFAGKRSELDLETPDSKRKFKRSHMYVRLPLPFGKSVAYVVLQGARKALVCRHAYFLQSALRLIQRYETFCEFACKGSGFESESCKPCT